MATRMGALTLGKGTKKGVDVGPLIDAKARDGVAELVEHARAQGATVVTGGNVVPGRGYFYEPTVITGVAKDARMMTEEIFGPVAPIASFRTEAEAIDLANNTEYGLASYVFTTDLGRMIRVAEGLQYGMIGINQGVISNPAAPFGGVKASGFGREGGFEGIEEYLETTYVGIAP
jgi:succinate-semialdehyde dehydrogenase/glutarate-semialdehyde dehydrogenase